MKKIFSYSLLLLSMLMLGMTGCKKEDLVFEYEKCHFETKANAILIELVVPAGTSATDEIYVIGAFNDSSMTADYMLSKHEETNYKFGIYLDPSSFVNGKTLADGFTFYNKTQGYAKDDAFTIENAQVGERYILSLNRWAGKGDSPEPVIPGEYSNLYVTGNVEGSSWDPAAPIEMTMVGTDIFRAELTFTSETSYFAFSTAKGEWADFNAARWGGAANDLLVEGETVSLINEGEPCVTIAQGTYTITVNMAKKIVYIGEEEPVSADKFPAVAHDGQEIVYVADNAAWGDMTVYMWGDVNNLDRDGGETAGWPGLVADGTFEYKGLTWYYFLLGTATIGKNENLIMNNNGGGNQTADYNIDITADQAIYLMVNADKSITVIDDPEAYDFGGGDTPEPTPVDSVTVDVFVYDATSSMNTLMDTVANTAVSVDKYMYV